jgi:DNA repair protein RadD
MTGKRDPKPYVEPEVADFPVTRVTYMRHQKPGKPDSVRVTYVCGMRQYKTFLCPDHGGGATARAKMWWRQHIDQHPPNGIDNWLERMDEARIPSSIKVRLKRDFPDVIGWNFE